MGRINEAMRRAAEEGTPGSSSAPPPTADVGIYDIETLAREAFPIELEEHRKAPRPVGVPPLSHTPGAASAQPEPASRARAVDTPTTAGAINLPARGAGFERLDRSVAGKIVVDAETSPASREQYRRMAATLHQAQATHGLKVVMVTSAMMGEGKTLTSSNLALTLSESYKKNVLLIDGDLRRPSLHTLFKIDASPGLSDGLAAGEDQRLAVRQVSPLLGILTAGEPSSDPIAGLTSSRMKRVIEEGREAFDWVIIDTPPVALLPDANILAAMADGTILVVRAGFTPWDQAQRAAIALGQDRVLGVVLNSAVSPQGGQDYGYYDYSTNTTPVS